MSSYPWIRPLSTSGFRRYLNKIFAYRMMFYAFDVFVYVLGPVLLLLALTIISGMYYTFFYIIVPMMNDAQSNQIPNHHIDGLYNQAVLTPIWIHKAFVLWIVFNILFNYYFCVTCRKDRPGSKLGYDTVVRQLALVTGFHYPESEEEKDAWIIEWRRKRLYQSQSPSLLDSSSNNERVTRDVSQATKRVTLPIAVGEVVETATIPRSQYNPVITADDVFNGTVMVQASSDPRPVHVAKRSKPSWMDLSPYEWSYCYLSNLPKAPRSHFDHVTQSLILSMDHYCPWMFNTIGYFNYRYFVNFLIYVVTGMLYGTTISYDSFVSMDSLLFDEQYKAFNEWLKSNDQQSASFQRIYAYVPLPYERTPIALSFVLCLTLGIAILFILVFHIYLIFTAQTTIEFHGNLIKRSQCKLRKMIFKNPYSLGPMRNLQQVYGSGWMISWLLPSTRDPEYLPIPLLGEKGLREQKKMKHSHERFSSRVTILDDGNLDV